MGISFSTNKLQRTFEDEARLRAEYGEQRANMIKRRIQALLAATSLGDFWPPNSSAERCHELTGKRSGQLSMDLNQPYRLIFKPDHDPLPEHSEGGLNWQHVTMIKILGVVNTHD